MSMREFHHAYFGAAALVLAWVLLFDWAPLRLLPLLHNDIFVWGLVVFGLWMISDDLWQHWRQRQQLKAWEREHLTDFPPWELYHSPVHRLYVWAFGGLHRKVVGWFR